MRSRGEVPCRILRGETPKPSERKRVFKQKSRWRKTGGIFNISKYGLQRESDSVLIQLFQNVNKSGCAGTVIIFMHAQYAGKTLFAVEGYPCELTAVVVEEPGRKTDAFSGGNIGAGSVVVCAVEIIDFSGTY